MIVNLVLIFFFTLLFQTPIPCTSFDISWYSKTFHGSGTFFKLESRGNCALANPIPSIYSGLTPVAINGPQYQGSKTCGMCIELTGNGGGKNPIGRKIAYVMDQCDKCKWGDIDLGESGDGTWEISWKPIPCPKSGDLSFYFERSNPFYLKIQPRGMKSPIRKVMVNGKNGIRTDDNFFEVRKNVAGGFKFPVTVYVQTVLGCSFKATVPGYEGNVKPTSVSNTNC